MLKLDTKPEKSKAEEAKDKIASNHKSFGNYMQRRFTFKSSLNNNWKVISTNTEKQK